MSCIRLKICEVAFYDLFVQLQSTELNCVYIGADCCEAYLWEEEDEDVELVGVLFRKLSKKLTPLDIILEKLRLRLRPKRGLKII